MKTKITNQKNILSKLTRALMFVALFCLSFKANAQCVANYTATVDPTNNGEVTFANTSSAGTGLYYEWTFGDGSYDNSVNPPVHTYGSTGSFYVCLTIYDSLGLYDSILGCYNTYCSTVNVINSATPCTASFTYSPDTTSGIYINNTSIGGSGANYFWDFGDGSTSTLPNPYYHSFPSAGMYYVCLTMNNSATSCSSTHCDSVFIGSSSGAICFASFGYTDSLGTGYFMNTSIGTGLTSTWTFGDGSSGTSIGGITHLYSSPGTYTVCLTITNFLGTCSDTYCDYIVIAPGTTGSCMGIVNPTYTYTDSLGYAVFHNTPSGSSPVYFWDFGDGANSSAVGNNSHSYAANGTYVVCLTVYETGGGTDSCQYCNYVTISSIPYCNANFMIVQDSSNLFNYFIYNSSAISGTATYFWDFGDGTTSTLPYPSHTYAVSSPVLLCLTITDGASCTDTYCDSINPGHSASSVFTVNVVNPLGVSENTSMINSLENYPNPFSDNTTISYSINKNANVSLSIIDLLGKTIATLENENKTTGNYTTTWNSESVAEGMYLLQLKVNNDISTKKLIINK